MAAAVRREARDAPTPGIPRNNHIALRRLPRQLPRRHRFLLRSEAPIAIFQIASRAPRPR
ncbi:hypothetical protein U91I_03228 [alpha proteobacterium U9-1i]|nr:hypothetical protein U91I_03228 [alpha proteobacterium U9-1i]